MVLDRGWQKNVWKFLLFVHRHCSLTLLTVRVRIAIAAMVFLRALLQGWHLWFSWMIIMLKTMTVPRKCEGTSTSFWYRKLTLILILFNPLTPRAFCEKGVSWTFWWFLGWTSVKFPSISSKMHLHHDSLVFLPLASPFATYSLRHVQKSKFWDFGRESDLCL